MAITRTARFSLHRWDAGGDAMNRGQFDIDNLQVETLAAIFRTGPDANKPAPGDASSAKTFYAATDTQILYYNTGTTWLPLNDFGEAADITTIEVGASASAGTGNEVALANHVHPVGTPSTPAAVAGSAGTGSSAIPARSDHVHALTAGVVDANALASNAVVTSKILDLNVTTGKIADLAVTTDKINNLAVTEGKIGVGAVTPLKIGSAIAGNGITRNVSTGVLSVQAGSGIIVDGNGVSVDAAGITAGNIADDSISTAKLQNNAVTADKIATDAVTPLKIAATVAGNGLTRNGGTGVISVAASTGITVGAGGVSVSAGGITDALLAANAVTEAKIASGAVTDAKIGTGAVTPLKIASTIVGTGSSSAGLERNVGTGVLGLKIGSTLAFDGTTGAVGVATNGITATQIANSAVTPLKIDSTIAGNGISRNGGTGVLSVAASTGITVGVGGVSVTALGITDALLAANAVITDKINDLAVTEGKLADGAVTEVKLGSNAVTEAKIGTGAVTEGKIGANAVTAAKIAAAVAGNGLGGGGGTALSVNVDNSTIEISADALRVKDAGVTAAKAGSGVYVNGITNSTSSGQKIRYTAEASLPTDGSAATGYSPGDLWFGF